MLGTSLPNIWADVIAVMALGVAILDHVDLRTVRSEMPSRDVGHFPFYLKDIGNLVRRARKSIVICCDHPAYGSFSGRDMFITYRDELQRRNDANFPVTIACLNAEERAARLREQFGDADRDWRRFRDANRKRVRDYIEHHAYQGDTEDLSFEQFIALVSKENAHMLQTVFESATKRHLKSRVPVYYWLADDDWMIFAIPGTHHRSEHAFYTHDKNLIRGILEITEQFTNLAAHAEKKS
jgi:hypothetical protein